MRGQLRVGELPPAFTFAGSGRPRAKAVGTAACPHCHLPLPVSVKRVREKYEVELSELEQSERKLQERCTELKGRLGEAEGERERLQSLVRQKEKELEDLRGVSSPDLFCIRALQPANLLTAFPAAQANTQMCRERASLAQVVRQEFADQLAASQEENQRVKAELAQLQARQQMELDEVHQR